MAKKEANKDFVKAQERGQDFVVEKLIAVMYKPSVNHWAEVFRDLSIGSFFIGLWFFIVLH